MKKFFIVSMLVTLALVVGVGVGAAKTEPGMLVGLHSLKTLLANDVTLPPGGVDSTYYEGFTNFGGDSFFDVFLDGVGPGYDVFDGVEYIAWCVDPYSGPPPSNGQTWEVNLYSSYDPNLPLDIKQYQGSDIPWPKINWILNNKGGNGNNVINPAIWYLITGQRLNWDMPGWGCPVGSTCDQLVQAADANFVPAPGQVIGVILRYNGIGGLGENGNSTYDDGFQDTIIEVPVPEGDLPAIEVIKTANPTTVYEPGGEVTFTVDVTNLSSPTDPVTITSLVDDVHGDLNGQGTCSVPQVIQPGATYTCQFTALVEGNAGYVETDTVTASGTDDEGYPVSDFDDATVTVLDVLPTVDLVKDVTPSTLPEPGGDFLFTLTIYNTSPEPVVITALVDDNPLPAACTSLIGQTLPVGGSASCQYTVTHTDVGSYPNTASVTVEDDDGNSASDTDNETVTVTNVLPEIEVVKTADPVEIPEPGGEVLFTVAVTNLSSPSDPVTITSLVDNIHGNLDGRGTCDVPFTLQAGETYTCQFTALVEGNAGDSETDIVTASGTDDDGSPVSDSDDAIVRITPLDPEIEVVKTADPTIIAEPGGEVTFTVKVTNLSNPTDPVTITSLMDDIHGNLDGRGTCDVPFTLQPGETYTCEFTALVEGQAGDSETDVVTASGTDDEDTPVSDSDDATVTIVVDDGYPEIQVVKTADPTFLPEPGGMVTFTVDVTNLSNPTDPVTIDSLVDDIHGDLNGQGTCSVPQVIQPGDTYTCQFTALVEGVAGDSETDTVTASGRDDEGFPVSDSDDATVVIESSTALYKVYFPSQERVNILSNVVPLTLGYEDLDFDRPDMDFDYNDWVTNIDTRLIVDQEEQNLYRISFNITPRARGGVRTHAFHIMIPADTFASNGTATLTIWDGSGNIVSSSQTPYVASQASDFVVIPCTCEAFPAAGEIINAKEGTPLALTQRTAELSIDFYAPAPFDAEYVSETKLGEPHGTGLFFDPYLEVLDRPLEIHQGDLRLLSIPTINWMWPEERVRIDTAYPEVQGPAPDFTFPDGWWQNHNTCVYGDGIKCPSALYAEYFEAE